MLFEEMMREEYAAGKNDGIELGKEIGKTEGELSAIRNSIFDFLADVAPISENLRNRILSVDDMEALKLLNKKAASVSSIEEFEQLEF